MNELDVRDRFKRARMKLDAERRLGRNRQHWRHLEEEAIFSSVKAHTYRERALNPALPTDG